MKSVVIENPILNSPFEKPRGISGSTRTASPTRSPTARRPSSYFIPIASPEEEGQAAHLRHPLDAGPRQGKRRRQLHPQPGRPLARPRLSRHHPGHPEPAGILARGRTASRRLFFCQIEALETLIYLTEAARRSRATPAILNNLRRRRPTPGPTLFRLACKMATGSGKTVVMAMLIAWHTLNKRRLPRRPAGSPTPSWSSPPASPSATGCASCCRPTRTTTIRRSTSSRPSTSPTWARPRSSSPTSTPSSSARRATPAKLTKTHPDRRQARRVHRDRRPRWSAASAASWASKRNIVVLNDEAHHCYRVQAGRGGGEADRRRRQGGRAARGGGPALDHRPGGGPRRRSASRRSTTCRPRRSTSRGPATRRGRCSRGWCPTSR